MDILSGIMVILGVITTLQNNLKHLSNTFSSQFGYEKTPLTFIQFICLESDVVIASVQFLLLPVHSTLISSISTWLPLLQNWA